MKSNNMKEIQTILNANFPNTGVTGIQDRGFWIDERTSKYFADTYNVHWKGKRIVIVALADGKTCCIKISASDQDWDNDFTSERAAYTLLSGTTIPVPGVYTIDLSKKIVPYNYIIEEYLSGSKLHTLWLQMDESGKCRIYEELGKKYKIINSIKGKHSGLIQSADNPYEIKYPVHPADHMYEYEIQKGSGKWALQEQLINNTTYDKMNQLWKNNIDYLKDHVPSLVHLSAFCWTISLIHDDQRWRLSKISACGDMMWWDPAITLALFRYPPNMYINDLHWKSFLNSYDEPSIEEKRVALYGMLIKLQSVMGVYFEPAYLKNAYYKKMLNKELCMLIETAS